jgi:hypothetical protein
VTRIQLATVGVAVAALTAIGIAQSATAPKLQLTDRSPLIVRGTAFGSRERVVVTLTTNATRAQRVVRATAIGAFVVQFGDSPLTACTGAGIVAVGGRGSVARLKVSLRECPGPTLDP